MCQLSHVCLISSARRLKQTKDQRHPDIFWARAVLAEFLLSSQGVEVSDKKCRGSQIKVMIPSHMEKTILGLERVDKAEESARF